MKKYNYILVFFVSVAFYSQSILAQVIQEWVVTYGDGVVTTAIANSSVVDGFGNVYLTGRLQTNNSDYATIKYSSTGVQQWIRRYNGSGNGTDEARSIAVDASGNVYVTGYSEGKGTSYDYVTIKYNSAGDSIWVRRYNGPVNNNDLANSIALDLSGNVYVTGRVYFGIATNYDYATIKYNSAGDLIWISRYNGLGNSTDEARSIEVDVSGNVYVTGYSSAPSANYDYATIKYNSAGDSIWVTRYNGPANSLDLANSIVLDGSGNVFVTGYSRGVGTNYDYATLKYNSSGIQQWVQRYNGSGNNADYANSMAVDDLGNVFVTGVIYGSGADSDYATIKYNSSGAQQWVQIYNGPGNGKDFARSLAVDGTGNVYVTGWSIGNGTYYDFATIKYNTTGIQQWVQRYHANYHDGGNSIAVDSSGNVYVAGSSMGGPPHFLYRYATIKYSQMVGIYTISNEIPESFSLSQNYPNPFNPSTKIKFQLKDAGFAQLVIYDILGRKVETLVNEVLKQGTFEIDFYGSNYTSGIYYYKLVSGDFSETKKMILIK